MQILDIRFPNLAISWKILITGFILILSAGYLNGALNAALSVGLTSPLLQNITVSDLYQQQKNNLRGKRFY